MFGRGRQHSHHTNFENGFMKLTRRHLMQTTCATALLGSIGKLAFAQANTETATIVTGFAAGGSADAISRRGAQKISPGFAGRALVKNRPGAGGQIAVNYVKGRPADGATILQTPTSILTLYPHIFKK